MKTLFDKERELGKRMISCIEDYGVLFKKAQKEKEGSIYIPTDMGDFNYMLVMNNPEKLRTDKKVKAYVLRDALRSLIDENGKFDENQRFIQFNINNGTPMDLVDSNGHSLLSEEYMNAIDDIAIKESLKFADEANEKVEKTIKDLEGDL